MKLPNGERAEIPDDKIEGYALNPLHPVGGPHAQLFARLLGITRADAGVLVDALAAAARDGEATPGRASAHGPKFEIRFPMTGPRGTFRVLSVWIIRRGTDVPRLVTAYVE